MDDEDKGDILTENALIEDLEILLQNLNEQVVIVRAAAEEMGVAPLELRSSSGDWVMRSLLVAKAHTINAICVLKSMERYAEPMTIYQGSGEVTT